MAKQKVDAGLFGKAAAARREEQHAMNRRRKQADRPRPAEPTITVTVRMTADCKQKLKEYAVRNKRTVSDVLSEFVDGLD